MLLICLIRKLLICPTFSISAVYFSFTYNYFPKRKMTIEGIFYLNWYLAWVVSEIEKSKRRSEAYGSRSLSINLFRLLLNLKESCRFHLPDYHQQLYYLYTYKSFNLRMHSMKLVLMLRIITTRKWSILRKKMERRRLYIDHSYNFSAAFAKENKGHQVVKIRM